MITSRLFHAVSPSSSLGVTRAASSFANYRPILRTLKFSTTATVTSTPAKTNVVVVDGIRLPFAQTSTIYSDLLAVDLQRLAFHGLVTKTALDKQLVDYVVAGTVIQEVRTSNVAREAAINAGFPSHIGAHTVAMVSRRFCLLLLVVAFMAYVVAFIDVFLIDFMFGS